MQAYIILPEGDVMSAAGLETVIQEMFRSLQIAGTAKWYWDDPDYESPTEYGVRIEVSGLTSAGFQGLLAALATYCRSQYGDVRVEVA